MKYLNIRHTLPVIDIRTQLSTLPAHSKKAELHSDYEAPSDTLRLEGLKLEINSYPSRKAYGFRNHTDFAVEMGENGKKEIKETTSRWTQGAWDAIENAAKPSKMPYFAQKAKTALFQELGEQSYFTIIGVPLPEISCTPYHVEGDIDPGHYKVDITTSPEGAEIEFRKGKVDIFLKEEGSLRMWVSEGKYDVYA